MITKSITNTGIRIVTETIPHSHSATIGLWVCNGSRHEDAAHNGIAHFIEHLLFKGTSTRSALDIAREIDSLGGVLNAFTGREYVCYYAKVLDRYVQRAASLLTDIFTDSQFNSAEIERERQVILQEIGMLEDTPDDYIHDLLHRNFWQGHPLGMPVIGSEGTVSSLTREKILSYRDMNYRGEDVIIAAAGNITHQQVVDIFSDLVERVPAGCSRTTSPPPRFEGRLEMVERELEQVHLCLGTRGLSQADPRRFQGHVLNTIFGASMSSRLFQEVREKAGLAYSIYSYLSSHSDAGSLVVYAGTSPDRLMDLVEILLRELTRLRDEAVTPSQLASAKEQLKGSLLLSLENTDSRMTKLAKNEIYFGRYQGIDEIMAGFDAVTEESLQKLARDLLGDSCLTVELMGRIGNLPLTQEDLRLDS
jgi:predicted Zn-dependent peptidase